jgi:hypothetical protein
VKNYRDMPVSEKQRKGAKAEGDKILSIDKTSTNALRDVPTKVAAGDMAITQFITFEGNILLLTRGG